MRYLLDSNVIIRYLNGDADTIQSLVALARTASGPLFVSTVTQMEVWEGVHCAANPAQVERPRPADRGDCVASWFGISDVQHERLRRHRRAEPVPDRTASNLSRAEEAK